MLLLNLFVYLYVFIKNYKMNIRKKLKQKRIEMHLSQAFVAQKLNVSIPTVHHIESMKQDYFRILNKYCELLNLEIILKDKDNENENNSTEKNSTPKLEVAECRCDIKRGTDENQLEEWKGKIKLAISLELVDE